MPVNKADALGRNTSNVSKMTFTISFTLLWTLNVKLCLFNALLRETVQFYSVRKLKRDVKIKLYVVLTEYHNLLP